MLISFQTQKPDYETFYQENYSRVLRYVCGKLSNSHDAEDLTGDVFLYCLRHYEDYDPSKGKLSTWLYLIVNSRIKNYYRDHTTGVDFEEVSETLQDMGIDLERGVYLEQLHDALMAAIASLPERQQKIVIMRYFENRSGDEIAAALGISPGNVRVLLSRSLDKLSSLNLGNWKEYAHNG